jgi:hypothetical protein
MPIRRNTLLSGIPLVLFALLGISFGLYIIVFFLTKPRSAWISVSNYGDTMYGAVFMLLHWIAGVVISVLGN